MSKIIGLTFITFVLMVIIYEKYIHNKVEHNHGKTKKWGYFWILAFLGLVLRFILAYKTHGHEMDLGCFFGWSNMLTENGFSNFYNGPQFADYPPGYLYILRILGSFSKTFHISDYKMLEFIYKIPACICDIGIAIILFKVASKHLNDKVALILSAFFIFNPAIIYDSAIWGQVDSIFTLCVVLMCYLVTEKKLITSFYVFAIGILIKPQSLIFTPIIIFGIIDQLVLKNFNWKNFLKHFAFGLSAIGLIVVLSIPFGLSDVFNQYLSTLSSYQYASTNAYNIWTLFGQNWQPQTTKFLFLTYQQWGSVFILLLLALSTYISFKKKNDESKYYMVGAILGIGMFVLSVRMHERYLFPGLVMLAFVIASKLRRNLMYLYAAFTSLLFANLAYVLRIYDYQNFNRFDVNAILISAGIVITFVLFLIVILHFYSKDNEIIKYNKIEKDSFKIQRSLETIRMRRCDFIALIVIVAVYSGFALYDLGDTKAPVTQWESYVQNDEIILDVTASNPITSIEYYNGNFEERTFGLYVSDSLNGPWNYMKDFTMNGVFRWDKEDVEIYSPYIKIVSLKEKAVIRELVLKDATGEIILPKNYNEAYVKNLFDEQNMCQERSSFRNSTYFDEIYHARTAYEYTQGIYSYENTHPPLGKIFISLGINIFGMNPFGWRIIGSLFGIAMLPFIYLFALQLLRKSWLAICTTTIFAFDFMHFAQTRIATIDVYVTFFIILMYYFMFRYVTKSFYDTKFSKTLIPLGISGVCMGLGVASKWTGVYAGVGLAVLFFGSLFKRYQEYCYAKKNPNGYTDGISHEFIINHFKKYAIKTLLFCLGFFVIIPFIIYTLSYIPFVDSYGRDLIPRMLKNQETMLSYHSHVDATHPFSSWWYEWPIMVRPIWYYSGTISSKVAEGISSFGNPLVWWAGIPACVYMIRRWIKKDDKLSIFLVIGYMAQLLPWMFVTRITFIYHYFPSVIFVVLMIGYSMYCLSKERKNFKYVAMGYSAAVVVLFLMFYPVLSGQPVSRTYVSIFLRWFNSWVLVS